MMVRRKISAGFFLLIYIYGIFYPLTPVLKDLFEHVFHHAEHLANVHHHHGHNHVNKEIKKSAEDSGNKESINTHREIGVHIFNSSALELPVFQLIKNFNNTVINFPNAVFISRVFPPPRIFSK